MIHHLSFVEAASVRTVEGAAAAFAGDVYAVLDTLGPNASTLALLAEFAICFQTGALRDAAGRPDDARWSAAFSALDEFLTECLRRAPGGDASRSFARLSNFLVENSDLAPTPGIGNNAARSGPTS